MAAGLVFAGAGASKAVGPELYPTTREFFELVPERIKGRPLFQTVQSYLTSSGVTTVDIEAVLWTLQVLRADAEYHADPTQALGYYLKENRDSPIGQQIRPEQLIGAFQQVAGRCDALEQEIDVLVYDLYSKEAPENALRETWIPLLDELVKVVGSVDVFTTNYDVVLEDAIREGNLPLETGRSRGRTLSTLDLSLWTDPPDTINERLRRRKLRGLLTKLHGSIDWSRGANGTVYVGNPLYTNDLSRHVILYPGFKGTPDEEPFLGFHEYFEKRLTEATLLVFIGFAFRDEYLNTLIERWLPSASRAQVVVVNPARIERFPRGLESRVVYLQEGFGPEAVAKILEHARSAKGS